MTDAQPNEPASLEVRGPLAGNDSLFSLRVWISWGAAAIVVVVCAWLTQAYFLSQAENARVSSQLAMTELALRSAAQQLEAERIITAHRLADRQLSPLAVFNLAAVGSLPIRTAGAVVWDTALREGVLHVEKLPTPPAGRDYQLWVFDPRFPTPVDAGVFYVDGATSDVHVRFRPGQFVQEAVRFAVSLERKGGASRSEGPLILSSQ